MEISLETLFEKQKQLDNYIIKKKGLDTLPKQELLNNTVLALQVEICELANEWRGFKHWSEDRAPRTIAERGVCRMCAGTGAYPIESDDECPTCQGEGEQIYNPLLEEYVDCLHFFLSIAWQIGLTADDLFVDDEEYETPTNVAFTILLYLVSSVNGKCFLINPPDIKLPFCLALYIFFSLGYQRFGFTWDEITQAYLDK